VLNLARTCSIGLRSGEYFGRNMRRAPTLRTALCTKGGARTYEAISQACGEILAQYPPAECAGYLKNAGYA
jgi:hypothetical protein